MERKIFVSYKYADGNVYPVPYISDYQPKVRDYVTWLEKNLQIELSTYIKANMIMRIYQINRMNIFGRSLKIKYMTVQ